MWNNFGVFARCKQLCGHMWYSLKFRVNFKKGAWADWGWGIQVLSCNRLGGPSLAPWKKSYEKPRQYIKKQRHYFANKDLSSKSYGFSSSHVWMWELHYKESWVPKNWCFRTVVMEKTLESPLDCKEIKPVNQPLSKSTLNWKDWCWKVKLQYFGHLMWWAD